MIVLPNGVIEVPITSAMLDRAKHKAKEMGRLKHSIRNGEGNVVGFLGEEIGKLVLPDAIEDNTYNHDLVWQNVTIDCKTKDRTVVPRMDYEATIPAYNINQKPDLYMFLSLYRDASDAYIAGYVMGIYEGAAYKPAATFLVAGQLDPTNGYRVKIDCYNMPYHDLFQLGGLI